MNYYNQITKTLMVGKQILDCYEKHGCPSTGEIYKMFRREAIYILTQNDYGYIDEYDEFLINNEDNFLPKSSSGSLYTALKDIDNFGAEIGCELGDFTEEHEVYFRTLYNCLFNNGEGIN